MRRSKIAYRISPPLYGVFQSPQLDIMRQQLLVKSFWWITWISTKTTLLWIAPQRWTIAKLKHATFKIVRKQFWWCAELRKHKRRRTLQSIVKNHFYWRFGHIVWTHFEQWPRDGAKVRGRNTRAIAGCPNFWVTFDSLCANARGSILPTRRMYRKRWYPLVTRQTGERA